VPKVDKVKDLTLDFLRSVFNPLRLHPLKFIFFALRYGKGRLRHSPSVTSRFYLKTNAHKIMRFHRRVAQGLYLLIWDQFSYQRSHRAVLEIILRGRGWAAIFFDFSIPRTRGKAQTPNPRINRNIRCPHHTWISSSLRANLTLLCIHPPDKKTIAAPAPWG